MAVVTLQINNRHIKLACNDGEEERLRKVAAIVNKKLDEYKSANNNLTTEMMLIMCALELQDQLINKPASDNQSEIIKTLDSMASKLDKLAQKLN